MTTPVGPVVTISGTDGGLDGSSDGKITFTADDSGTDGATTLVNYYYYDIFNAKQIGQVVLGNGQTASIDIAYVAAGPGPAQSTTVASDAGMRQARQSTSHRKIR